ncbi:MAG: tetratricopeptide repeat protein, partial [Xanthomonadales bacterium]|nr:tetratricopeptide repeat protein [Xanthomonadales bacterium]
QRDRAQHVTQFLIDAFAAANPGGEMGKSVTAKQILEHGAKKLETELDGQPELKAQLLATIAEAQLALDLVDDALVTGQNAESLLGDAVNSAVAFKVYFGLASAHLSKKNLDSAERYIRLAEGCSSNRSDRLLVAYLDATHAMSNGENKRVWVVLEKALSEGRGDDPIDNDLMTKIHVLRLGSVVMTRSDAEIAAYVNDITGGLNFEGLKDRRFEVRLLRRIAFALNHLKRSDEAELYAVRAVTLSEALFGRKSISTAAALNTLAATLRRAGKGEGELALLKESFEIISSIHGPESPAVKTAEYNYADGLNRAGRASEAEAILRRLSREAELRYGSASFMLMVYRDGLFDALRIQGRCLEAHEVDRINVRDFSVSREADSSRKFKIIVQRVNQVLDASKC